MLGMVAVCQLVDYDYNRTILDDGRMTWHITMRSAWNDARVTVTAMTIPTAKDAEYVMTP